MAAEVDEAEKMADLEEEQGMATPAESAVSKETTDTSASSEEANTEDTTTEGSSISHTIGLILEYALFFLCVSSYLHGLAFGFIYPWHYVADMKAGDEDYMMDWDRYSWMDRFSMSGIPGIHEMGQAPYYVPGLKTFNWKTLLGLREVWEPDVSQTAADQIARLDNLVYEDDSDRGSYSWVFVTRWGTTGMSHAPQDDAFDELLQYHYATPLAHNASLHFMKCMDATYLCRTWGIRETPAMLLFRPLTEPEKTADNVAGRELMVEHISLPLNTSFSPTVPRAFPSWFEQLRWITTTPNVWDHIHTEDPADWYGDRAYTTWRSETIAARSWLRHWTKFVDLSNDYINIPGWCMFFGDTIGTVIGFIDVAILRLLETLWAVGKQWFLAYRTPYVEPAVKGGFWEDFWGGAINGFIANISGEAKNGRFGPGATSSAASGTLSTITTDPQATEEAQQRLKSLLDSLREGLSAATILPDPAQSTTAT